MIGKLTEPEIDEVLKQNTLGHIGCTDGGRPYVVPVSYVFDGKNIIGHSVEGLKVAIMRNNPLVCFEVDEMKDFTHWKSVVLWGEFRELTEERERYQAMKLFVDRMMHLKISESAVPPEVTEARVHPRSPGNIKPVIYRIIITEKTGRYEHE